MTKINLQMFADGDNTNQTARSFSLQFKELLAAVFQKQAYFGTFFGNTIEAIDGVQDNENAFYVKTSDMPVVLGEYSKDANTAMGTGTGESSRFGERKEVNLQEYPCSIHLGLQFS